RSRLKNYWFFKVESLEEARKTKRVRKDSSSSFGTFPHPFSTVLYFLLFLEVQTKLRFELSALRSLRLDIPEGRCAVQGQIGISHEWVVENIGGVHAELPTLGFRDPDGLAHRCVEGPSSRQLHRFLAESAAMPGQRILKKNLACLGVCHRLQRAVW